MDFPSSPPFPALRERIARQPRRMALLIGLSFGTASATLLSLILLVPMQFIDRMEAGPTTASFLLDHGFWYMLFASVVFGPLWETVIGQVLPLEVCRRLRLDIRYSVLASAVSFALLHALAGAGWVQTFMTLIAGGLMAGAYMAVRGAAFSAAYLAAATTHAVSNGVLLFLVAPFSPE